MRTMVTSQAGVAIGQNDAKSYQNIIVEICNLNWKALTQDDLISVAWAYYYFSVQFRACLESAMELYPDDDWLRPLDAGEPWLGVVAAGKKMNHDEFMRRTLELTKVPQDRKLVLTKLGLSYLQKVWKVDRRIRALALASYEDGGLERVFSAILTAPQWDGPLLQAFQHFLVEHIRFDSDPQQGHGSLCRHLRPDDRVAPLWAEFKRILVEAAPCLAQ